MTKRNNRKYGISRRLGASLWGSAKDPVNHRNYAPGMHGSSGNFRKLSDYGSQLLAKQKLKKYYGDVTEKQFRRTYQEAARRRGETSENLVALLESRLDAFVYRCNFVPTIFAARQFVNHKHVLVNGKTVNIPSYRLKPGDIVEVREKSKQLAIVQQSVQDNLRSVPEYIAVDDKRLVASFVRAPQFSEIPYPINMEPNLVVEFYSR